ncbi:MAG: leucyl aminopeptidase [Acidobacteriota bacterium]
MTEFSFSAKAAHQIRADAVALFCQEGSAAPFHLTDRALRRSLMRVMKLEGFRGKEGETLVWHAPEKAPSPRYLVVGTGTRGQVDLEGVRRLFAGLARRLGSPVQHLATLLPGAGDRQIPDRIQAAVEGVSLGSYRWDPYLSQKDQDGRGPARVTFLASRTTANTASLERGRLRSRATLLARDLTCEAPSVMTPREMEKRARRVARSSGLTLKVIDERQAARMGMGCLLGVARGSQEPPRLLHLTYRPRKPAGRVALVGKGITFDSGGLSLKPANSMETMKSDMAGSAAVLAILSVLGEMPSPLEVHGVMVMAENMPSGRAYKPGDILRSMSGKTVEVLNTDAEGRLILADGLEYAKRLKPDRIIDLATLTGACMVALGTLCSGVMGFDRKMVDAVLDAGKKAGEKLWPLPFFEEYRRLLDSKVADIKHLGARWGGAITAGMFLGEFVGPDTPWVHIDIAGPAFADKDQPLSRVGGTGHPVRTLLTYLDGLA